MSIFKERVLKIVKSIPAGEFMTYKEVAQRAGNKKAARAIGNLMAKNQDPFVPCHRVIKNDLEIGKFMGSAELSFKKAGLLLKEGSLGVIPTDTIYGLTTSAFKLGSVEKIYKIKKRNKKKPLIILISKIEDLKGFGIKLNKTEKRIIAKKWPGKVSIILPCHSKNFTHLHRGTKTLAIRMPADRRIKKILKTSGPLVAPSANTENNPPAKTIGEAKKYFGKNVFYLNKGKLENKPSALIRIGGKRLEKIR